MRAIGFRTSRRLDTGDVVIRFYFWRRFPGLGFQLTLTPSDARRVGGALESSAARELDR